MLCYFPVYSKVMQILFRYKILNIVPCAIYTYYRMLNTVPCAIQ